MDSIWIALSPGARTTRVLAMRSTETILKAHLSLRPGSARAAAALLEAIALWEGLLVRAALVVGESSTSPSPTTLYQDLFSAFDSSPLYRLDWVPLRAERRRRRGAIVGMGEFGDLERLLARTALR